MGLVADNEAIECVVVAAGLAALQRGSPACSEAMLSAKARVKPLLEARLNILGTIGSNSPISGCWARCSASSRPPTI